MNRPSPIEGSIQHHRLGHQSMKSLAKVVIEPHASDYNGGEHQDRHIPRYFGNVLTLASTKRESCRTVPSRVKRE